MGKKIKQINKKAQRKNFYFKPLLTCDSNLKNIFN